METVICSVHNKELKIETEILPDGRVHKFARCVCDPSDSQWYGIIVSSTKIDPDTLLKSEKSKSKFTKEEKES